MKWLVHVAAALVTPGIGWWRAAGDTKHVWTDAAQGGWPLPTSLPLDLVCTDMLATALAKG